MALLVVTDNDIERCGVESALARHGVEARGWDPAGGAVDSTPSTRPWVLVLIDVTPSDRGWDRLPAVGWLHRLRPALGNGTRVVGWSGSRLTTSASLRLARAGLTELVERPRRPDVDEVLALRSRSLVGGDPMPSPGELGSVGLSASCDVDAGLALVTHAGLEGSFVPGFKVTSGLARRRSINFRRQFAQVVGLRTTVDRFSALDDRDLSVPTWCEVSRVVNDGRGFEAGWSDEDASGLGTAERADIATAS